jgi:hypothetical protein
MSNKSCSDYVKGYNDGYSSTCGKNRDGCDNILTAISPERYYRIGWIDGNHADIHDFMSNPLSTRPNQTMQNCPRTYCQGYWTGYRSGRIEQIDVAGDGPCFPGMQKLILAKCSSGARLDSNDCTEGIKI